MNGGEGLAEVGVGGGFPVEIGESLTSGGLFANCLTFLLQEIGFDGLLSLFHASGNLTANLAQLVPIAIS